MGYEKQENIEEHDKNYVRCEILCMRKKMSEVIDLVKQSSTGCDDCLKYLQECFEED